MFLKRSWYGTQSFNSKRNQIYQELPEVEREAGDDFCDIVYIDHHSPGGPYNEDEFSRAERCLYRRQILLFCRVFRLAGHLPQPTMAADCRQANKIRRFLIPWYDGNHF
jgi:hypothetical protein